MPWADTVFQNWDDCIWEDWTDCEWDFFSIVYWDKKTRTIRRPPAEGLGNPRRPYLEGNPSYVEDSQKDPDISISNTLMQVRGETRPHMTLKQPYRYEQFQKMKYQDEPSDDRLAEEPQDIEKEIEYIWQWTRYLDDTRWAPT